MENRSTGLGSIIAIGAVALIVLMFVMTAVGPHSWLVRKWNETPGSVQNSQSAPLPATGLSIVGGPSLSAQRIDQILSNAGSPAAGTGQTFYDDSVKYNIDDSVALAFFKHESSYGTRGEATQSMSIGNLRCITGYTCQDGYTWFPSWRAGIDAWYRLISGPYYAGGGLTTLSQIIPKYAPSADNNDESAYIAAVQSDVASWRQS